MFVMKARYVTTMVINTMIGYGYPIQIRGNIKFAGIGVLSVKISAVSCFGSPDKSSAIIMITYEFENL